ncbi:hypothetical protein B0H13DRAFT_1959733 [Mycena leptocephala]|nr:hypothetical protein B0H13DRAFT_1959733 [Mycena leptocephala]
MVLLWNPQISRTALDFHSVSAQYISPAHSLYFLYQIIVLPPVNIFTRLKIPLNTPTDAIRSILIQQSDTGDLPAPLAMLLKHLGSFDRPKSPPGQFGHSVVSTCDYCLSFEEFGLFALPRVLLSYVCAVAVIGIVTINNSGPFCVEVYYISTIAIEIPKDDKPVFMVLARQLLLLRRLLFLILPPLVHMLPPSASAAALVNPTVTAVRAAEQTAVRLQLLAFVRGAVMRVPDLRARAAAWWADEAREGDWVREDEGVRDLARKLNNGFDEGGSDGEGAGPLRSTARNTVTALKTAFTPSEYWRVSPS